MLVLPPYDQEKAQRYLDTHPTEAGKYPAKSIACKIELNQWVIYLPQIAQVRNPRLLQALKQTALSAGAEILEHEEVVSWRKNAGMIAGLATTRAEYRADRYIVCAGAWSSPLLADYNPPPIKPVRGQMLLFRLPQPTFSEIILQDGFYLIPRKDGHVLAGSTLEDAGFSKETTLETKQFLLQKAQSFFPQLNEESLIQHWSGLRPGSIDNIPTIARHPHIQNLYMNSGHFRYGLTMAPGSAELLANLLLDLPQPIIATPYSWE
jgi:glycine oxidase